MARTRLLVVSNGHGEDSIAAEIVRQIGDRADIAAFALIGAGHAYDGVCEKVGPRTDIPSQGSRRQAGTIWKDLPPMLRSTPSILSFLRSARHRYDRILVVGDMVGPILAILAGLPINVYLDVFKSGYAHRYSRLEAWVLRRVAKQVFTRDEALARDLMNAGVAARTVGNVMLDTLTVGDYDIIAQREASLAVAVLPGSRIQTAETLALQAKALGQVRRSIAFDAFVAIAAGIDVQNLAAATGLDHIPPASVASQADLGILVHPGSPLRLHLVSGAMGILLANADVVLSQAGTASQQAAGLGKPVLSFHEEGYREKRMRDVQAMFGESRLVVERTPETIANALHEWLIDANQRATRGEAGRTRMGGTGTAKAVIDVLLG